VSKKWKCPHCGSEKIGYERAVDGNYCYCKTCGACGPICKSWKLARREFCRPRAFKYAIENTGSATLEDGTKISFEWIPFTKASRYAAPPPLIDDAAMREICACVAMGESEPDRMYEIWSPDDGPVCLRVHSTVKPKFDRASFSKLPYL